MRFDFETVVFMLQRLIVLVIIGLGLNSFWVAESYAGHQSTSGIHKSFDVSQEVFTFPGDQKIYGLSVSGSGVLHGPDSLIRIILVAGDGRESLAYEIYPLLASGDTVQAMNAGEETRFLDGIDPRYLKIQLVDASFILDEVTVTDQPVDSDTNNSEAQQRAAALTRLEKINKINNRLSQLGLKWTAGETSISKLSFEEKRNLFGSGEVPNLQGAEFYVGGVYQIQPTHKIAFRSAAVGSSLVEAFDWRQRHGADRPQSPYYDGDPSGSGWMTPVRDQASCGSCWAFAAVGSIEALANIYFNQHLDLDLSEQDLLSCSGAGDCDSGRIDDTFSYISVHGVTDEACFPYSETQEACTNKCSDPNDVISADSDPTVYMGGMHDEEMKVQLINGGPGAFYIFSWKHDATLVGYSKDPADGRTVWSFKNSWGEQWGENGYGNIKCGQIGETGCQFIALQTPVRSNIIPYEIGCFDRDGDGYYNWGLSESAPDTCPRNISARKDCDDSDALLGFMDSSGACVAIHPMDIDIIPGDNHNCIGLASNGDVAVAVLSTVRFDAMQVDPPSITFCGAGSTGWIVDDINADGADDMLFYFNIADLNLTEGATEAPLEGNAHDGLPVIGKDKVCISPDHPPYFQNPTLPSSLTFPGKACFSGTVEDDFGLKEMRMEVAGPGIMYAYPPVSLSGTSADLGLYCFDSREARFAGKAGSYTVTLTAVDSADQPAARTFNLEYLVGDADGDGVTDDLDIFPNDPTEQSDADADGAGDNADCDDGNPSIHPGAAEVCNGLDDNCDGRVDEVCQAYYQDADGDGYGNAAVSVVAAGPPAGYVSDSTDCDDLDGTVNPGAAELEDGKDNNCDGQVDEGFAVDPLNPAGGSGGGGGGGGGGGCFVSCLNF